MENQEEESMSEFGRGFAYCLGLFLAHEDRLRHFIQDLESKDLELNAGMLWMDGASDHIRQMETETIPEPLREQAEEFKRKVLEARCARELSKDQCIELIQEAKYLLYRLDTHLNIPAEIATWS